ncbi:hypothetical protein GJA_199 [Janthinobacterium agaricidamnosum NBRC 102515 = DSM 9628]|uniref:Uncharacterized protein n=1 Tax=Janthinobacterium agaricidamnosum NBRC 102515 = DSM 9628 TaxID=1349767 RepID=W0V0P5_9BURK|nr:hypothetical protein GJA_199 [Janthinobacterium agaricidamnosum NBRC 102515 = DSM 9628]
MDGKDACKSVILTHFFARQLQGWPFAGRRAAVVSCNRLTVMLVKHCLFA